MAEEARDQLRRAQPFDVARLVERAAADGTLSGWPVGLLSRYLTQAITKCGKHGLFGDAVRLLVQIRPQLGMPPDQYMLGAALMSCHRARRWDKLLALVRELGPSPTVRMDHLTYWTAMHACYHLGEWEQLVEFMDDLLSQPFEVTTDPEMLQFALSACARSKQWASALRVLRESVRRGQSVHPLYWAHAIEALQDTGDVDAAFELLGMTLVRAEELQLDSVKLIAFEAVLDVCRGCGDWGAALDLLDLMADHQVRPTVYTYAKLLGTCKADGKCDLARELLRHFARESDLQPDVGLYNAAISSCMLYGDLDEAAGFLDALLSDGIVPDNVTFSSMYATAAACSDREAVKREARRLFALAHEVELQPDVATLNAKIKLLVHMHQTQRAIGVLEDMLARGLEPDEITFTAVLTACKDDGNTNLVFELLSTMGQLGVQPNLYHFNAAIGACSHVSEALILLHHLEKRGDLQPTDTTLRGVLRLCIDGQWETAEQAFLKLTSLGVAPVLDTYELLLTVFEQGGQTERAQEVRGLIADLTTRQGRGQEDDDEKAARVLEADERGAMLADLRGALAADL